MTFQELCQTFNVTAAERQQLAWFLAQRRAHALYEKLRTEYGRNTEHLLSVLRKSISQSK